MKVELNQDLIDLRRFEKFKKPSDLILNIISNSVSKQTEQIFKH